MAWSLFDGKNGELLSQVKSRCGWSKEDISALKDTVHWTTNLFKKGERDEANYPKNLDTNHVSEK